MAARSRSSPRQRHGHEVDALFVLFTSLLALSLLCRNVAAMLVSTARSTVFHDSTLGPQMTSSSKSVIIQIFQWDWDSVALECTTFIGPAGYGYVQVSPPQEHVSGTQWWTDYQPVSYTLTSKRGNRTQFKRMINSCHNAGVKVIVDTIFNHMAALNSGTGIAGHSFTHYNHPGIYEYQDFHHCGLTVDDEIVDYTDRAQVLTCQFDHLADLATETRYVQEHLAAYGNDLIALGVDGFRLDAAKHVATEDITNILGRLSKRIYICQEVIWGNGEAVQPSEYVCNGDVTDLQYTTTLKNAFLGFGSGSGGIAALQDLDNRGNHANVFVANHDTERDGNSLNINSPSNTYILATIFSLAHPYGTPVVLSSYSFSRTDEGAPNGGKGTCSGTGGSGGWLCQHRYLAFSGMVGFHNSVGSAAITDWVSAGSQRIAFGRGSAGFIIINNMDSPWTAMFTTSLADGMYCDVIAGGVSSAGTCIGPPIMVNDCSFTATVKARDALAIHEAAMASSKIDRTVSGRDRKVFLPFQGDAMARFSESIFSVGSTPQPGLESKSRAQTVLSSTPRVKRNCHHKVSVTFQENAMTQSGDNIFLVGNITQLGNWDPDPALALSAATYPVWTVTVSLTEGTTFQYKYIRKESDGAVIWESDPNREDSIIGGSNSKKTLSSSWR